MPFSYLLTSTILNNFRFQGLRQSVEGRSTPYSWKKYIDNHEHLWAYLNGTSSVVLCLHSSEWKLTLCTKNVKLSYVNVHSIISTAVRMYICRERKYSEYIIYCMYDCQNINNVVHSQSTAPCNTCKMTVIVILPLVICRVLERCDLCLP